MTGALLLGLEGCRSEPEPRPVAPQDAPPRPPLATTWVPWATTGTTTPPGPVACDIPDIPIPPEGPTADASTLLTTRVTGYPYSDLGDAVVVVDTPEGPTVAAGAPGIYGSETEISALWFHRAPVPPGELRFDDATAILWGKPFDGNPGGGVLRERDGDVLALGDLTGDGTPDLVSGSDTFAGTDVQVVAMPPPVGVADLALVAAARIETEGMVNAYPVGWMHDGWDNDIGDLSTGDYDGDGQLDLVVVEHATDAVGAQVFLGPLAGPLQCCEPGSVVDDAAAWFDVYDAAGDGYGGPAGDHSVAVPDVDGDGKDEVLVHGYEVGWTPNNLGLALFLGGSRHRHDISDAHARLYTTCNGEFDAVTPLGDVTGDGRADVAVLAWEATVGDVERGVVWIISRLHEATGFVSFTAASDAVIAGHSYDWLGADPGMLAVVGRVGDLDLDGVDDLAISTNEHVYLFFGPISGFLDLNDADLTLVGESVEMDAFGGGAIAAGDVDLDGVPDLVVGDPMTGWHTGELLVFSGAGLLAAAGR